MKLPKISAAVNQGSAYRIRIPGFKSAEEVGLGDVIKHATSYLGMKPCGGCMERAATLNRWVAFTRRAE